MGGGARRTGAPQRSGSISDGGVRRIVFRANVRRAASQEEDRAIGVRSAPMARVEDERAMALRWSRIGKWHRVCCCQSEVGGCETVAQIVP